MNLLTSEEKAPPLERGKHQRRAHLETAPARRTLDGCENSRMKPLYDKPRIFATTMAIEGVPGVVSADTIEYLEYFWLVPGWLAIPHEGLREPIRLIWLQPLVHQRLAPDSPFGDFVLAQPLPKDVWEGKRTGEWFVVVERPDIWFEIPAVP